MLKSTMGITFIELLIVLVIISILTAIGYSSLLHYVLKIHRADAIAGLINTQFLLERCRGKNFSYSSTCDAFQVMPLLSPQAFYSISISNLNTSTYTLTATPLGNQKKDLTCSRLTINQANVKTATDSLGMEQISCWKW